MSEYLVELTNIHVDTSLNVSRGGRSIASESVRELAEDIKVHGLMEPLGVVRTSVSWLSDEEKAAVESESEWILVFGFRRYAACKAADLERVRCIDQGALTLAQAELVNVAENWSREPPNEYDLTVAIHRFATSHKLSFDTIAQRSNKTRSYVSDSVQIVSQVSPKYLERYRVNCSRAMRRKMLELASLPGRTPRERQETQDAWWRENEEREARSLEVDPQAGFRTRPGRGIGGNVGGSNDDVSRRRMGVATRDDLRECADAVNVGSQLWNGVEWIPLSEEARTAMRSLLRWAMRPTEIPVR